MGVQWTYDEIGPADDEARKRGGQKAVDALRAERYRQYKDGVKRQAAKEAAAKLRGE